MNTHTIPPNPTGKAAGIAVTLLVAFAVFVFNQTGGELRIAFSPEGKTLVSVNAGKFFAIRDNLRLWDVVSGESIGTSNGHGSPVFNRSIFSVAYHPNGCILATGGRDEQIVIWELGPLKKSKVLPANLGFVTALSFSPNGACLAAGGTSGVIRIWETSTWTETWSIRSHKTKTWPLAAIWDLQFGPDSRILASASRDNTIGLWRPDSNPSQIVGNRLAVSAGVTSVAFSPDGTSLASAVTNSTIVIWDIATLQRLRTINLAVAGYCVAFSPDGSLLAIGRMDGRIELRDPKSGTLVRLLEKHRSGVMSVAFERQGQLLASASSGFFRRGDIKLWHPGTGTLVRTLRP